MINHYKPSTSAEVLQASQDRITIIHIEQSSGPQVTASSQLAM